MPGKGLFFHRIHIMYRKDIGILIYKKIEKLHPNGQNLLTNLMNSSKASKTLSFSLASSDARRSIVIFRLDIWNSKQLLLLVKQSLN